MAPSLLTALGATVIAAAGSESKLDIAKQYGGADYGVNYSKAGWQKEVLKFTNGKGVNVVFDPVGLVTGRPGLPAGCCQLKSLCYQIL
jgi:NADPH:quinone reductase-like Zn-dependent oxidoreductase